MSGIVEWNAIFFGKNPNIAGKVDVSDTLYSKTQKAINNTAVYAILSSIEKQDENNFFKETNDIYKAEISKVIQKKGKSSGLYFTPANANSLDAFLKDMIRAMGDGLNVAMTKNNDLKAFSVVMTKLKKGDVPAIGKDGVKNYVELTAAINKFMKTDFMKEVKDLARGRENI